MDKLPNHTDSPRSKRLGIGDTFNTVHFSVSWWPSDLHFRPAVRYVTIVFVPRVSLPVRGWIIPRWWKFVRRSALINIRRKALLSSVGFRKRMTSRSPRGSPCDSYKLSFDCPLWFGWWSDVCFEVLSYFFDHPSIDSTKKMPLHLFGKDVLMFRLD